ncbi:hypothetical protein [Bdellovibrio sp. HCB337]|uniref:hypothetical protein n=1 Tax=Bdellovibrio sp. HCB337 TaxID=3394358 RepID=UPI0039A6E0C5
MQKIVFSISLILGAAGLILVFGEVYRKSHHKDKVLAEMAIVVEDVKNAPKFTPAYDSDGVPIQSDAEVKFHTDNYKMNCMTQVINTDWKVPVNCEPVIMSILTDPFDRKDLSFRVKKKFILPGVILALAPFYFLILRGLVRRLRRKKS